MCDENVNFSTLTMRVLKFRGATMNVVSVDRFFVLHKRISKYIT